MERIPRAIYTKELREEAVKLVTEGGLRIPEVGRRLSVAPSTIRYWVKANKEGKLKEVGKQQRPLMEIEMELAWVKRELAEVRMERVARFILVLARTGIPVRGPVIKMILLSELNGSNLAGIS